MQFAAIRQAFLNADESELIEIQINGLLERLGFLLEIIRKLENYIRSILAGANLNLQEKVSVEALLHRADQLVRDRKDFLINKGRVLSFHRGSRFQHTPRSIK